MGMIAEIGANIMRATFSDWGIFACITGVISMALIIISFRLEPDPEPSDPSPAALQPAHQLSGVLLAEEHVPQRRMRIASIARISRSSIEKKRQQRIREISA
jgi:hypothetical protein